ncbi:response regulator [Maribacter sp. CXY002]|uniref:response regulator n=1 Tax=Maribacter luteocoastalis TaxID=3407671 RepID=UPI003B66E05F
MFQKVLVVEDLDSIGFGIAQMLKQETAIKEVQQSLYCDDAVIKFLRAQRDNTPFDLLITDLSFKADHRESKINSGDELVKKLKLIQPGLKAVVYSVEDRSIKVKSLFNNHKIDGYVVKGRKGFKYLLEAIHTISKDETYTSPDLSGFMSRKEVFEIEDYDIELLKQLSNGLNQKEIASLFQKKNIQPSGISSIEKRLNLLKLELNAKNVIQLVAMGKDLGWV